jgi:glycerol-3-phosphate dehydrogenase
MTTGGGAWGTALAAHAARMGHDTVLWAREPEVVTAINEQHENTAFLKVVFAKANQCVRHTTMLVKHAVIMSSEVLGAVSWNCEQAKELGCVFCRGSISRSHCALQVTCRRWSGQRRSY